MLQGYLTAPVQLVSGDGNTGMRAGACCIGCGQALPLTSLGASQVDL